MIGYKLIVPTLTIGTIIYLRREDKVVAAKYLGWERKRENIYVGFRVHVKLYRADGISEEICIAQGDLVTTAEQDREHRVYGSIEDAIRDTYMCWMGKKDVGEQLRNHFGFHYGGYDCELRKTLYKWDGYRPKAITRTPNDYTITYCDNQLSLTPHREQGCVLYESAEACQEANEVRVVTF